MADDEPTLRELDEHVRKAQEALMAKIAEDPHRWWEAEELRDEARNGSPREVMMYALTDLVNREELTLDRHLRVRKAAS